MPRKPKDWLGNIKNEARKAWNLAILTHRTGNKTLHPLPFIEIEIDNLGNLYRKTLYGEWINIDKEKKRNVTN